MGRKAGTLFVGSMIAGIFTYVGVSIGTLDVFLIVGNAFAESLSPNIKLGWQIAAFILGLAQTAYTIISLFKGTLFHIFFSAVPFFSTILVLWQSSSGYATMILAFAALLAFWYDDSKLAARH